MEDTCVRIISDTTAALMPVRPMDGRQVWETHLQHLLGSEAQQRQVEVQVDDGALGVRPRGEHDLQRLQVEYLQGHVPWSAQSCPSRGGNAPTPTVRAQRALASGTLVKTHAATLWGTESQSGDTQDWRSGHRAWALTVFSARLPQALEFISRTNTDSLSTAFQRPVANSHPSQLPRTSS